MFERHIHSERSVRASLEQVEQVVRSKFCPEFDAELVVEDNRGFILKAGVRVSLGTPAIGANARCWPLSWRPSGHQRLLPGFAGTLSAAAEPYGSRVVLDGVYRPPWGVVGAILDRVNFRAVAASSVDAFVAQICAGIDAEINDQNIFGLAHPGTADDFAGHGRLPTRLTG